jgi:thiamine pyrophosphate-dependent acetolactate synthase large subunit-like protein
MTGGERIADALVHLGVRFVFTLCGGHISPILVAAKACGIRVIDVRNEATAVFAADAAARLSGVPGIAVVTAGPGLSNTITAIKNAQLAQSPVVLLGGATATVLAGRGALQDIDQRALLVPHVKSWERVRRVRETAPAVARAFHTARAGVPGPVFVEYPVDVLYPEALVREWYQLGETRPSRTIAGRISRWYLRRHLARLFGNARASAAEPGTSGAGPPSSATRRAAAMLSSAKHPIMLIGSQAVRSPTAARDVRAAVEQLGVPVFLSGMARGLLGASHPLLVRHRRGAALQAADVVFLAGVACDFRLEYGRAIAPRACVIAANLSSAEAHLNRRPSLALIADPAVVLSRVAERATSDRGSDRAWLRELRARDDERRSEIARLAAESTDRINPILLCNAIDHLLPDDSVIVADGGDFVGTASYAISPRAPLSWLDPGPLGTLGVGAGFALGAKLHRPGGEVWILYGDGSAAYSLAEFDTLVRHGVPVIAVVGNDGGWTQIARGQLDMLGDDVATVLRRTAYERVAEGFGARGLVVDRNDRVLDVLREAQAIAHAGEPVLVNALMDRSKFREGSLAF